VRAVEEGAGEAGGVFAGGFEVEVVAGVVVKPEVLAVGANRPNHRPLSSRETVRWP
jgi:hypothetical protein